MRMMRQEIKNNKTKNMAYLLVFAVLLSMLAIWSPFTAQAVEIMANQTEFLGTLYGMDHTSDFEEGAKIRLVNTHTDSAGKNDAIYTFNGTKWEPLNKKYVVWGGKGMNTFYAILPIDANYNRFELPLDQSAGLLEADWMTGQYAAKKGDTNIVDFNMEHRLAKVTIIFDHWNNQYNGDETVSDVFIYSNGTKLLAAYEKNKVVITAEDGLTGILPEQSEIAEIQEDTNGIEGESSENLGDNESDSEDASERDSEDDSQTEIKKTAFTAIVAPAKYTSEDLLMSFKINGTEENLVYADVKELQNGLEAGKHYTFKLIVGDNKVELVSFAVIEEWTDGGNMDTTGAAEEE